MSLVSVVFLGLLGQGLAQTRSLTLDEMFQLADQNNNRIRLYDLAISEAEQGVKVACNDRLPSIQAHVELNYIGDGVMTDRNFAHAVHADMPHFGNSFVLKASQVIYAGGAVAKGIERSRLQKKEAELEYVENRQDIRFLLAGYYLDLFQLNNQKRVYESNISQTRLLVKDMKASYRQGTALKSDITRYELQLQSLELSLTSVKDKIDVLSHKLATAVGLEPDVLILPDTTELLKFNVENRTEEDWLLEIHHTPSVRLADIRIEQEKNKQDLIRAERRPKISLVAANDFTGPILIEVPPLNNNFTYWYAGVGISYNIDALFKSKRKLKQAQLATRKMEEARRVAEEEAENDIHAAYVNLNEAYIRLRTQKKSVQLVHENFNIVRQRYVNGLALITDMLNAVSLNWCVFIGILAGAGVVFYRQVVLRKGYKLLITVGFMLIVVYQYYMYFLIHPNLNIESLYIPNFLKGLGHGILYISLTIYVAKTVPFEHFFQGLCVLSFIRTSIATPLGTAILNRWLKYMQQDNIGLISRKMDLVKEWMPDVSIQQLYEEVTRQTLLTSLKELFGAVCIVGTIFLLFLLSQKVWRKLLRYVRRNHPRYIQLLKRSQPAQ